MALTPTLILAVLGLMELIALAYVWRTNRRLDVLAAELRAEMDANRRELDEKCRALSRRIEEMRERIGAANRRLDETIEAQRLLEDLNDINDRVMCLRTPGGMSKRMRRTDHRQ